MKFTIPELSFVVLIGVSGSGMSTFARKQFKAGTAAECSTSLKIGRYNSVFQGGFSRA